MFYGFNLPEKKRSEIPQLSNGKRDGSVTLMKFFDYNDLAPKR